MARDVVVISPKIAATKSYLKNPTNPQFNPPMITKMNATKPIDFISIGKPYKVLDLYRIDLLYKKTASLTTMLAKGLLTRLFEPIME